MMVSTGDQHVFAFLNFIAVQAVRDVDKLLASAYEERAKARAQGKHFADDSAFQGCVL